MRVTAIFLLFASLQVSATGFAQKVNLSEKNASLKKVLSIIEKQTTFSFIYKKEILEKALPVTIDANDVELELVLNQIFLNQPFSYRFFNGNMIGIQFKNSITLNKIPSKIDFIEIKGRVTDNEGEPLSGASVRPQGSDEGTTTNSNGEFELMVSDNDTKLEISFIGYETKIVNIPLDKVIKTSLSIANKPLDEILVKGYYLTTKKLNTGDVTTVVAKDIERQPVNNPLLVLQALVPGLQVKQTSGLPGTGITVRIRGQNSMLSGNDPLFLIDGVPYNPQIPSNLGSTIIGGSEGSLYSGNPFSYINPNEIENITVLKDADATAIYGSRGANGVLLITTKKGKPGRIRSSFNVAGGFGKIAHKVELMNTSEYLRMRRETLTNDGRLPTRTDYDLSLWDTTRYTDWQKVLLGNTARYTDVQSTISGGSANTQFLISSGYHKESTVFPGDLNDQKVFLHFNLNNSTSDQKMRFLLSGSYSLDNSRLQGADLTQTALTLPPNAPALYKSDGSINWAPDPVTGVTSWNSRWTNPAAARLLKYNSRTNNLIGNAVVSYKPIYYLELKVNMGYTYLQNNEGQFNPMISRDPARWAISKRSSMFTFNNSTSWIIEPQITFTKDFEKHKLSILAGSSVQQSKTYSNQFSASGFSNDLVLEDIMAAPTVLPVVSSNVIYKYQAVYARLGYSYNDKYLVNLTARTDGSSRFISNSRFHNFGAIGAAWVFTNESFFKDKLPVLSYGKIRGSWGTTGSDQIGDYVFMDLYQPFSQGVSYQGAGVILPTSIYAPELKWEETKKLELGIELGAMDDRIIFNVNLYQNKSSNQLLDYTLPASAGFTSVKRNLPALVENKGVELEIKSIPISNSSFKWLANFNISFNRNKLKSGARGLNAYYSLGIGHPLNSPILLKYLGVDPSTGLYKVADVNGNPVDFPSDADYTSILDVSPKFFGGIQNNFIYKNLEISILVQFVKQKGFEYLYNGLPGRLSAGNQPRLVLNHWGKPGDIVDNQRFGQTSAVSTAWLNASRSDQSFADASYIRCKNIAISWLFPKNLIQKLKCQNAKIFIQGQNLFTITKYRGLDPETRSSITLPPLRMIAFGIQLNI